MNHFENIGQTVNQIAAAQARRNRELYESQVALPHLLSGDATWAALQRAVADLTSRAPQDHDVLLQILDLIVLEARFIEPHTFLFEGITQVGHRAGVVCHFTQVVARVVYLPKRGESRVITGFSKGG